MYPQNEIVVRSDASTRDGEGIGVAYQISIYNENSEESNIEDRRFVNRKLKSTEGETIAILFALRKLYNHFIRKDDDDFSNYNIIIESDCQHAIDRVNKKHYVDNNTDKFMNYYLRMYNGYRARWVAREMNTKVDAMARETFRRGTEGEATS